MIAWVIVAAVAVPLVVVGFFVMRRSADAGEHPAGETDADRERTEREFEESERYQAEWREEQHKHQDDTLIP